MNSRVMKKSRILFPACLALCLWSACDERAPGLYDAPDGIYFDNRASGNVPVDTVALTFVYEPDETEYLDVPVLVRTVGRQSDTDRPVSLKVWSDNAEEGTDYELPTPAVVPARASALSYVVRLRRTEAIRTELKSVHLELSSNEYFATFPENDPGDGAGMRPSDWRLKFRIDFSDFYSTPPAGWLPEYVGEFSERKLRLMWKLFDGVVDRRDYNVKWAIPFNKWVYMQREISLYMYEQEAILRGYAPGTVDVDALVDPSAEGDDRRLLDFTPVTSDE